MLTSKMLPSLASAVFPYELCLYPLYEQHVDADLIVSRFSRRSYLRGNPHFPLPNARSAQILWSSSCRCGVHLKTVLWTVRYMSGVAPAPVVKDRPEGRHDLV